MSNMKIDEIIKSIESLEVKNLLDLVKQCEETWGVTAAAAVGSSSAAPAAEAAEEKSSFDVLLTKCGDAKIKVMKVARQHKEMDIGAAKKFVEEASDAKPAIIKTFDKKEEAEALLKELKELGAEGKIA